MKTRAERTARPVEVGGDRGVGAKSSRMQGPTTGAARARGSEIRDNRPAAVAQRKLQQTIDRSPQQLARAEQFSSLFGLPVQRMPTGAQVIAETGKQPKQSGSERYKVALSALDELHGRYAETIGARDHVAAQATVLHMKLDKVTAAFLEYLRPIRFGKKHAEGRVGLYFKQLLSRMGRERSIIENVVFRQERTNGQAFVGVQWSALLGANAVLPDWQPTSTEAAPLDVSEAVPEGEEQAGGQKSTLPLRFGDYLGRFAEDDKLAAGPKWILNKYGSSFKWGDAGEDKATVEEDPRLAARSVAMSRLDAMLGGGVIARTEFAIREGVLGTYMKEAKSKQLRQAQIDQDISTADQGTLARLLSRLQLIDSIAGQVDRHRDNLFIRFTAHDRKVIEVTGIDLDMAWGTKNFDPEAATIKDQYPGFSRFVDKQIALRIIALDPQELWIALRDLLSDEELDAAVSRLQQVQRLLAALAGEGKLLEPTQWTQMTLLTQIHEEQSSYMARAMNFEKLNGDPSSDMPSAEQYVSLFPNHTPQQVLDYLLQRRLKVPKSDVVKALTAIGLPEGKRNREVARFGTQIELAGLLQGNW